MIDTQVVLGATPSYETSSPQLRKRRPRLKLSRETLLHHGWPDSSTETCGPSHCGSCQSQCVCR
jgi:hypothetical protein